MCEASSSAETHLGRYYQTYSCIMSLTISPTGEDIIMCVRRSIHCQHPSPLPPTLLRPQQSRVEMLNGELIIHRVQQADSGMYQCVAENKYGAIYSSAELKILGKYLY